MDHKKQYIAPQLTVVKFKTERGYALSSKLGLFHEQQIYDEFYNSQNQENWEESGNLFDRW